MSTNLLRRDAAYTLEELQRLANELVELYGPDHHPSTIYLEPKPVFALEEETLTDGSKVLNSRVSFKEERAELPPIAPSSSSAELQRAGERLALLLEEALETHIYEPDEVPADARELEALEAWRKARGPIGDRDPATYVAHRARLEAEGYRLTTDAQQFDVYRAGDRCAWIDYGAGDLFTVRRAEPAAGLEEALETPPACLTA